MHFIIGLAVVAVVVFMAFGAAGVRALLGTVAVGFVLVAGFTVYVIVMEERTSADHRQQEEAANAKFEAQRSSEMAARAEAQRKEAAAEAERKQPVVMICYSIHMHQQITAPNGIARTLDGRVREINYVPNSYQAAITKITELTKDDHIIERAAPSGFKVDIDAGDRGGIKLRGPADWWGYCTPKSSGRQVSCDAQYFPNEPKLHRRITNAILYGKPGGFLVAFRTGDNDMVLPIDDTGEFGSSVSPWLKGRCTVGG